MHMDQAFRGSDMYSNLEWALSIYQGDVWQLNTFHPYHTWMQEIGSREEWNRFWKNSHIYQQSPLYAYFLSLLMFLCHGNLLGMKIFQVVIGSISCVLMYLVTRKYSNRRAACIAALIAIGYFPSICFESFFLREFLCVHLMLWLLYVLPASDSPIRAFFGSGVCTGLLILTRENFVLLPFLILPIFFLKFRSTQTMYYVSGLCLMLTPLLFRNYLAGAPLLSFSNRLPEALIEGLAYDATHVFMSIPDSFHKIFHDSEGRISGVIKGIIQTYPGIYDMFLVAVKKVYYLLHVLEPHNNLNLYYFWQQFPVFQLLPNYGMLFCFGSIGFFRTLRRPRNRWIPLLFMVLFASLLLSPVIARYRYTLLPFYIFFGAIGIQSIYSRVLHFMKNHALRHWLASGVLILGCLLCSLLSIHIIDRKWTERDTENAVLSHIQKNADFFKK